MSKTFCMIKPDAVENNLEFDILNHITNSGMKIARIEKRQLNEQTAQELYAEHSQRPFFGEICDFITSGEVVLLILEHADAVKHLRNEMGATNSADADPKTIRGKWGDKNNIMLNRIHGSDSPESAEREISIMFN